MRCAKWPPTKSTWRDFFRESSLVPRLKCTQSICLVMFCRLLPSPFTLTLTASCSLLWTVFLKKAIGNTSARSKPAAECLLSQSICPPRGGTGGFLSLPPLSSTSLPLSLSHSLRVCEQLQSDLRDFLTPSCLGGVIRFWHKKVEMYWWRRAEVEEHHNVSISTGGRLSEQVFLTAPSC